MTETYDYDKLVDAVRKKIPTEESIEKLAELYKVFGDPTRAKILSCLEISDLYVNEIAEILNMSISAISH